MIDELQQKININEPVKNPFKLYQIKLTHFYWSGDDKDYRYPISTSIEYISRYDYLRNELIWDKKTTHKYVNVYKEETENKMIEQNVDFNDKLKLLETLNLVNCKNNFYTETEPERFTYWEINYNTHFYIVGTYDQDIKILKEIYQIFDMKKIINSEIEKIKEKIKLDIKGE